MQKGGILVADDLAADFRLLEDVHGLEQQRQGDAEVAHQLGQSRPARERFEDRIDVVERMADLVDRALLAVPQPARLVERLPLEEEANLVARFEEIAILCMILPRSRENRRHLARLERLNQLRHPPPQRRALGPRHEPGQDQVAIARESVASAARNDRSV